MPDNPPGRIPDGLTGRIPDGPPGRTSDGLAGRIPDRPPPDPQPFVDRLVEELALVRWPEPAEIRARARRRTIRVAVAAPTVIVAILAGAWTVAFADRGVGQLGPSTVAPPISMPSEAPTTFRFGDEPSGQAAERIPSPPAHSATGTRAPSPMSVDTSWIPPGALLQPADLGAGHQLESDQTFLPGSHPSRAFDLVEACPGYAALAVTAPARYRYLRVSQMVQDTGWHHERRVQQEVGRYPDGTAKTVLTDLRRVMRACRSFDGPTETFSGRRPTLVNYRWLMRGDGFAGDESLLLSEETVTLDRSTGQPTGSTSTVVLYAVVRVDDLVAVVRSGDHSELQVRQFAARAAARMCVAAANPC